MGDAGDTLPVRVWCDGCYDMVHFGHANSLRQAKALGDYLVVGVHSDEEISKQKGPTVFTQEERVKMLHGIRWVDEVVDSAPYITTEDTLDKHHCTFCVHGEDITTTAEGMDAYHQVKAANRYKTIKRTPGVSTTEVVGRMLQMGREECNTRLNQTSPKTTEDILNFKIAWSFNYTKENFQSNNGEELTSLEICPNLTETSKGQNGEKVVYVTGAFDMFHVGHLDFLHQAAAHGDYLIVGLHTDLDIKRYNGNNYPIMSLSERALSLLACKYVSKVVMGAPYTITKDFMQHFHIDSVCHGQTPVNVDENGDDPYKVPKELGAFYSVDSRNNMTTEMIVERIIRHRLEFEERNRKKEAKEMQEGLSELKV